MNMAYTHESRNTIADNRNRNDSSGKKNPHTQVSYQKIWWEELEEEKWKLKENAGWSNLKMKVKCVYNKGIAQPEDSTEWIEVKDGLAGSLTVGNIYEVLEIDGGDYRIIDDEGEDYLYPAEFFEIVDATHLERHFLEKQSINK